MPKPGQAISVSPQTLINITSHNAHIKASHGPPCNCICFATETPRSPKCQDTHSKAQVQRLKNGHMTHCYARFKLVAESIPGTLSWLDLLVGISSGNILCKWSWSFLVFMCLVLVVYVCVCSCVNVGEHMPHMHVVVKGTTCDCGSLSSPWFGLAGSLVHICGTWAGTWVSNLLSHCRCAGIMGPSYYLQLLYGF